MASYIFDSSGLGKHYHAEIGTAFVDALLQEPGAQHCISWLTVVELHSVFAGKVRTGVIAAAAFQLLRVQLHNLAYGQHVTHRKTPSCSQRDVPPQTAHGGGTVSWGTAPSFACANDGYDEGMTSLLGTDDGYDRYDGLVACSPQEASPPL